jgi:hypothetical protein
MKHARILFASMFALVATSSCAPAPGEDTATAQSAFMNLNALPPAALDAAATYPDALTPAMLAGAPLDPASLGPAALAAIQAPDAGGALSRSLLSYTVGCSLDATQSFRFSWVDASNVTHEESYQGLIGLATEWASSPLDRAGKAWVSACLVSRVNYFGVHVHLSSRGESPALGTTADEVEAYPYQEGAFWGDLFAATTVAYACNDAKDDENSREMNRVCAAGYVDSQGNPHDCGIIRRVGSCDDVCAPLAQSGGAHHPSCTGGSGLTTEVVTVFLEGGEWASMRPGAPRLVGEWASRVAPSADVEPVGTGRSASFTGPSPTRATQR